MRLLLPILFVFTILHTSYAVSNEIVSFKGIVKSVDKHKAGAHCSVTLQFIDDESGKSFELENAEKLEALHCETEKDFIVTLTAQKETKFLFWGGGLKMTSFEILGERESEPHISTESSSKHHRPERIMASP